MSTAKLLRWVQEHAVWVLLDHTFIQPRPDHALSVSCQYTQVWFMSLDSALSWRIKRCCACTCLGWSEWSVWHLYLHVFEDESNRLGQVWCFWIADHRCHHVCVESISDVPLFSVLLQCSAHLVKRITGWVEIFISDQRCERETCRQDLHLNYVKVFTWYNIVDIRMQTWVWIPYHCFPACVEEGGVCAQIDTPIRRRLTPPYRNLCICALKTYSRVYVWTRNWGTTII